MVLREIGSAAGAVTDAVRHGSSGERAEPEYGLKGQELNERLEKCARFTAGR